MVVWIDGPYGVGKTALAKELIKTGPKGFLFDAEAVGDAVRENTPKELFYAERFEEYPLWFDLCAALLRDICARYDGLVWVPMTLTMPDSFAKVAQPLQKSGIAIRHILLESTFAVVHERILARGEEEGCWCMRHIELCLAQQSAFSDVIRIRSVGAPVGELAACVRKALSI